jgi:5-methylcytosine-specific restriction endonuclease McrA
MIDMAKYMRLRRSNRRRQLILLLGGVCIKCQSDKNLQVDHIDKYKKTVELSGKGLDGSWKYIIETELPNCQLLCIGCHDLKSKAMSDYGGGYNKIIDPKHGTAVLYTYYKCRCEACRQWKRLYRNNVVDSLGNYITNE